MESVPAQQTPPPTRWHPGDAPAVRRAGWRAKCGLLLASVALLLVLDLVAAQIYRRVAGNPWPAGQPERVYRLPVDPYHHDLRPSFSTDDAQWGNVYPLRTNSLGFRDAAVREVPLEPEGRRIVFIGDSFTEGIGVRYEETFVGRVAAALAPDVEVLNAGVIGYSPVIYYRKIRHLLEDVGLRFDELIVAIDVSDAIDESRVYELSGDVVRPRSLGQRAAEFVKTNSIMLWTFLDYLRPENERGVGVLVAPEAPDLAGDDAAIEAALRAMPGVLQLRGNWPHDERFYREFGEPGTKLMVEHMDRLLALVRQRGIALRVVVYPYPAQIIAGDPDCRHVRAWREWCARNGVPFIDASPKFEIGCAWPRRAEIIRTCYIPGDFHMTAEGNRLVAEAILAALPR